MAEIRIERFVQDRLVQTGHGVPADPRFAHCVAIRHTVFTLGQGVAQDLEFDGLDGTAEQFLAWRTRSGQSQPVGTARLRIVDGKAKAERVAVLNECRDAGIGRRLMEAIEERTRSLGLASIMLNAQVAVIPFYEGLGYRAFGPTFEEAGIEHRSMSKALESPTESDRHR